MKYLFKLYVTGSKPNSSKALENLRQICREELSGEYDIKMFDILKDYQQALEDQVIATPTVIKVEPPPPRRLIGDLSHKEKALQGLGLRS